MANHLCSYTLCPGCECECMPFLRFVHNQSFTPLHLKSLNLPVIVRVDNITYSLLGYPSHINVTSNLTNMVITPTQTQLTAEAGSMQFNLTFLNPIEVRIIHSLLSRTHTFVLARRSGQAINPILLHVNNCKITGRFSPCCPGVCGYQRRCAMSSSSFPVRSISMVSQNGCRRIGARKLYGMRRQITTSSTTASNSKIQKCSARSPLKRNGAHCTLP